jgi:demethylmenaquinone methyltransferase/2-methoxy-6-polyprenyl-1,4-benzoquinol methylase
VYTRPERQSDLLVIRDRLLSRFAGFADNRLVPGSVHPIARRDEHGNTYQQRRMTDGSSWEVLKNFPSPYELQARLSRCGQSAEVEELDNYWLAWCRSPR